MKIKWSLDINTGAVERSEAARARRLAGATVVGPVTARGGPVMARRNWSPGQNLAADQLLRDRPSTYAAGPRCISI